MTVVLLTVARRCKSASSRSYDIKSVELLVRYNRRDEIFLPWWGMPPMCSHSLVKGAKAMSLVNILWAVVVILIVLWLLGWLVGNIGGGLIHILLVIAVIVLLYNIFVGMRRGR
jgi:membrane protein required for beta-lactamase induction